MVRWTLLLTAVLLSLGGVAVGPAHDAGLGSGSAVLVVDLEVSETVEDIEGLSASTARVEASAAPVPSVRAPGGTPTPALAPPTRPPRHAA